VRKIIFGLVALAAFALVHHEAAAAGVKITEQNVKDVCGAKLKSGGGMMGCTKTCGSNGEHLCDFHCEGGNKSEGQWSRSRCMGHRAAPLDDVEAMAS
jgi:hypothetical protein